MKAIVWDEESSERATARRRFPPTSRERADAAREKLIEALAEVDDGLMEKYLDGERDLREPSSAQALRKAPRGMKIVPVVCGSAFKNKGVQPLLDAVVDYLPSPLDVPPVKGVNPNNGNEEERLPADDEPFTALAFKIMTDPYVGTLTFLRVYSGV